MVTKKKSVKKKRKAIKVEKALVNCKLCGDKGFTELNHGLVRVLCECAKGDELRAELMPPSDPIVADVKEKEKDDSTSGTGQPDSNAGSLNTGEPEQPEESETKRKAKAGTGKLLQ